MATVRRGWRAGGVRQFHARHPEIHGVVVFAVFSMAGGCGSNEEARTGTARAAVAGGSLDESHGAIMGLVVQTPDGREEICAASMAHVDGTQHVGSLLTAASCVDQKIPLLALEGVNLVVPDARYAVLDVLEHPEHEATPTVGRDLAVVRVLGVDESTPTLPALTPEEDQLAPGSTVFAVGYGPAEASGGEADAGSFRNGASLTLDEVDALAIWASTAQNTLCYSNGGGPLVSNFGFGERIAGVLSTPSSESMNGFSAARVSASVREFVEPAYERPVLPSCSICQSASSAGAVECVAKTAACERDPECLMLASCLSVCADRDCTVNCLAAHATVARLYTQARECFCGSSIDGCRDACAPLHFECATDEPVGCVACGSSDARAAGSGGVEPPPLDRQSSNGGCRLAAGRRAPFGSGIVAVVTSFAFLGRRRARRIRTHRSKIS